MLTRVVFIGKAGSGKTSAAEHLNQPGKPFLRVSFAEPLKYIAGLLWECPTRKHYLELGRKVREIDPDTWLNLALGKLKGKWYGIAIDDCRFPNEAEKLKELGFVFIRINCPDETRKKRLKKRSGETDYKFFSDPSETLLDGWLCDYAIDGSLPLEEFLKEVEGVVYEE